MSNEYEDQIVEMPIGYLLENCNDWDGLCAKTGLNPWVLNEGRASREDTYGVEIGTLREFGILP